MSAGSSPLLPPESPGAAQLRLYQAPESDDGPPSLSAELTLPEFWLAFFSPVRLIGADPRTSKEDRTTCRKWESYAGRVALQKIDRPLLAGFVPYLREQGLSVVTAVKHLSRVQTWLRAAGPDNGDGLNAELLSKIPRVRPPRCPHEAPDKAFRLAEISSWLDACPHAWPIQRLSRRGVPAPAWWQSITLFDYCCPLRIEAIGSLRWEWLIQDPDDGRWWVKVPAASDKKDHGRQYYVSSHAWRALEILGPRRESGEIFGMPLSSGRLYAHARHLLSHATLNSIRRQKRVFHGLRAAADTELRRLGFAAAARFALGHSFGRDVGAGYYTDLSAYADAMERMPMPEFTRWREPQLRLF